MTDAKRSMIAKAVISTSGVHRVSFLPALIGYVGNPHAAKIRQLRERRPVGRRGCLCVCE